MIVKKKSNRNGANECTTVRARCATVDSKDNNNRITTVESEERRQCTGNNVRISSRQGNKACRGAKLRGQLRTINNERRRINSITDGWCMSVFQATQYNNHRTCLRLFRLGAGSFCSVWHRRR